MTPRSVPGGGGVVVMLFMLLVVLAAAPAEAKTSKPGHHSEMVWNLHSDERLAPLPYERQLVATPSNQIVAACAAQRCEHQ